MKTSRVSGGFQVFGEKSDSIGAAIFGFAHSIVNKYAHPYRFFTTFRQRVHTPKRLIPARTKLYAKRYKPPCFRAGYVGVANGYLTAKIGKQQQLASVKSATVLAIQAAQLTVGELQCTIVEKL